MDFRSAMLLVLLIVSSLLSSHFLSTGSECNTVCSRGSSTCPETVDIIPGRSKVVSRQCSPDSSLVIDVAEFAQVGGAGRTFTVTFLDTDNYQRFSNGSSYNYSSAVGTGDVGEGSVECYDYGNASARFAVGAVYVVVQCVDQANSCHVTYVITFRCETSDPCAGIDCKGNGVCVNGSCECDRGYADDNCTQYDPCVGVDCSFHGSCRDGRCSCYSGYTGSNCSQTAPDCSTDCSGNGYCSGGTCICEPTFSGDDCSQTVNIHRGGNTDDGGLSTTSIVVIVVCVVIGSIIAVVLSVAGGFYVKRSKERDRRGLVASHSDSNILSRGSKIIEENSFNPV